MKVLGGAAAFALVLSSCSSSEPAMTAAGGRNAITVASFDFAESEILAQIYAQALRSAGYPVRLAPRLGSRELVEPALAKGLVTMVPEYAGSALEFLSLGSVEPEYPK